MANQQLEPLVKVNLSGALPQVAEGKVRNIFKVDEETLLFIATDRISAYDVIMKNGIPQKGKLLNLISLHWNEVLSSKVPGLKTHFLSPSLPQKLIDALPESTLAQLRNRSVQVRRLKPLPLESIVRGFITGSAWNEYKKTATVHGIKIDGGPLLESQQFPAPLWTPSTKAEQGEHDENISPDKAAEIVGKDVAAKVEKLSLELYTAARGYAFERGIIIADTKFEFALDGDEVVLIDEILTPDSSRFWPAAKYQIGQSQQSFDKQFLRDWLTSNGLKGKEDVEVPTDVVRQTSEKYIEAFETLTGKRWEEEVMKQS